MRIPSAFKKPEVANDYVITVLVPASSNIVFVCKDNYYECLLSGVYLYF
jgi:hypothetical protein